MILTARREPRLLMAQASLPDGWPIISVDGGRQLTSSSELSDWLDRPVELVSARTAPGTFENPRDIDNEDDWVELAEPCRIVPRRLVVRVDGVDPFARPTTSSRRFRINLILDGADDELDEEMLVERDITIGSVGFHVRKPIDRCIMVVPRTARHRPPISGVLKRLIRERDNLMGVGARVYREGTLAVGDAVHPLPD